MKNEKIFESMGYMDEDFLAENLEQTKPFRKRIFSSRTFRNLLVAALTVALLCGVVFANTVPASPEPDWEPYAEADVLLDILFGTGRYSVSEGLIRVKRFWVGIMEDGTAHQEEVRIPITSSASREPVSEELAAMVKPYFIPVGKTVKDPTGTMTLEVMTYFYEPKTGCGVAYVRLTDPTGEFGGYVLDPPIVDAGTEIVEDLPKGIEAYLQMFEKPWGHKYSQWSGSGLRLVEEESDEYTWTFAVSFWADEDTVDMDIGFRTELGIDYPQYRVDIDLERSPTMETITLYSASVRETVTLSPVSMRIDGSKNSNQLSPVTSIVIHFEDGSSYVVRDDEACIYGIASSSGYRDPGNGRQISFLFSNIIDIRQVKYVQIDGANYLLVNQ